MLLSMDRLSRYFFLKGAKVSEGEVVLILEAMKMENEVVSTISGILKKMHVTTGQVVNAEEFLFLVE